MKLSCCLIKIFLLTWICYSVLPAFGQHLIFPFGMASPTLLDLATTNGLLMYEDELPSLYSLASENLGIHFFKATSGYSNFISANANSQWNVSGVKHNNFLLYWFCKYFKCTNSIIMVSEFPTYVSPETSRRNLAPGPLFLSLLYRDLFIFKE